jgi:hypothetical protein
MQEMHKNSTGDMGLGAGSASELKALKEYQDKKRRQDFRTGTAAMAIAPALPTYATRTATAVATTTALVAAAARAVVVVVAAAAAKAIAGPRWVSATHKTAPQSTRTIRAIFVRGGLPKAQVKHMSGSARRKQRRQLELKLAPSKVQSLPSLALDDTTMPEGPEVCITSTSSTASAMYSKPQHTPPDVDYDE